MALEGQWVEPVLLTFHCVSIKFELKIILIYLTSIINIGQSIGELVVWHLKRKKLVSLTICWPKLYSFGNINIKPVHTEFPGDDGDIFWVSIPVNLWELLGRISPPTNSSKGEILCVAFKRKWLFNFSALWLYCSEHPVFIVIALL
jgi:hypothetical protein